MKKTYLTAIVALALFLGASAASAALVTQWEYTNDAIFVDWLNTSNTQTFTELSPDGRHLEWGVPAATGTGDRSAITINGPVSGTDLLTDVNTVNVVSLVHNNWVLDGTFPTLKWGLIEASVEFTPFDPAGVSQGVETALLEFLFFETPNVSATPFDIFVLVDPGLTSDSFFYQEYRYDYSFTSIGFGLIEGAYDDYLDAQLGEGDYFGWLTGEEGATTVQFQLSISSAPVPEPGTLLMLGSGLLGLAYAVRARRRD